MTDLCRHCQADIEPDGGYCSNCDKPICGEHGIYRKDATGACSLFCDEAYEYYWSEVESLQRSGINKGSGEMKAQHIVFWPSIILQIAGFLLTDDTLFWLGVAGAVAVLVMKIQQVSTN